MSPSQRGTPPRSLIAALSALAFLCGACHASTKPNVVVVLIDTLRADRLGAYGSNGGLTPFIDSLAAKGTVFRHAYSTCSWTEPAVASLFTSRYPAQLHMATFESKLADDEVTLGERLQQGGYRTTGFLAHFQLSREQGFAQGFDTWWTERRAKLKGERLRDEATRWLDQRVVAPAPLLLYFHYLEPHFPYAPVEPFRSRSHPDFDDADVSRANAKFARRQWGKVEPRDRDVLESLYGGEVATVDEEIHLLFAELERRGVLTNAVVVITADHGEEFMEHGRLGHGLSLYNELIHIPLIIIVPGVPGGRIVEENVSLVDVAPTVLDLAGLPPEPRFEGTSLASLLRMPSNSGARTAAGSNRPAASRDIVVQLEENGAKFDLRRHRRGLIRGSLKLVVNPDGAPTLYDLTQDPSEQAPVPPGIQQPQISLLKALSDVEAGLSSRAGTRETTALDEGAREKLRALGYDVQGR